MHLSRISSFRNLKLASLGILLTIVLAAACQKPSEEKPIPVPTSVGTLIQPNAPLSANDVSWLFPAPTKATDFANLIAVADVTTPNSQDPTQRDPIWPDAVFQQVLAIANGPQAQGSGTRQPKSACPSKHAL